MINGLEILVEEPSCEQLLHALVPRIVPGLPYEVRLFNGKPDLLRKLPQRLAGYATWVRAAGRGLVVLIDRDQDDCLRLKESINVMVRAAGLTVASDVHRGQQFDVLVRIVVEELEAWLIGDIPALQQVYPRVPESLEHREKFRDPDAVPGGTAKALGHELKRHGYHRSGLRKIDNAARVAEFMDVEQNRSTSFRHFRDGLRAFPINKETCHAP